MTMTPTCLIENRFRRRLPASQMRHRNVHSRSCGWRSPKRRTQSASWSRWTTLPAATLTRDEVQFQVVEQELEDYRAAADFLNFSNVDVVSLAARIRHLWRPLRQPHSGTLARPADAGRHDAAHGFVGAQSNAAGRDDAVDSTFDAAGRDDRAVSSNAAEHLLGR